MIETRYTAEELLAMQPEELDRLIEALVIGGRPGVEIVRRMHEGWLGLSNPTASFNPLSCHSCARGCCHLSILAHL
jgi:hypothetical protein